MGLIAIVELQYVWLVNTYKLTKESIQMKGEELFPEAALQEVFLRVSKTKKDSTVTMNVNFDAEKDMETMSTPGQWLMSYMHVSFQEIALKDFNRDVSFMDLDSIYAHMLDSIGFPAAVASCIVDSTGRIMKASSQLDIHGKGVLRTSPLPISFDGTRFLQGVITNPYRVIFQRMTLLLLATVLIMVLVIACIIYQIRIILRQNKIAKLREDFSYAMIHDMKTPLSSILMGTQILETGKLDAQPEKKARYFRILREEGEHLLSLTNKVLTLSKLENHQLKLEKETCSLRPMLEDLAEKYKAKAVKHIVYKWNLQADTVYADEEFLKEALSNLIDNAVKYSGEEVEITFSSGKLSNEYYIKVHDTGFGIPLKDQSKIFEKYERASASGRSRYGGPAGFGLGLNYVLRVAEAHGGKVTLESIEGEYSEFTIYLPVEEDITGKTCPKIDNE
ncbi:aTPase/histidine kinase/DNA gyrase B/HSP90 domain protein [Bacteroides sp. CAG:1076]|nr:aTPase/histidine kinase/DNA gyrase B/HSP90 domain protein [Bacteroides sp. CAG:1076]